MKTKLYLNLEHFNLNDLKNWEELILIVPFFKESLYKQLTKEIQSVVYDSIFTKLFFNGKFFLEKVNTIKECDFCVLPFRFNLKDRRLYEICNNAKKENKKVIAFLNDDDYTPFDLPENLILFRTSLLKSKKRQNEYIFPVILPDLFGANQIKPKKSIGFCGRAAHGRENIISAIENTKIETDFIIRDSYWFHWAKTEKELLDSKLQYNKNLLQNEFCLCYKGNGNYSWRFYEALMFDRIPILIDSDTELPFSKKINWNKHIIFLRPDEIDQIPQKMKETNITPNLNRNLWLEYFSSDGFVKNIFENFK